MGEVKLIGNWSSPFVRKVEIALQQKGVEYEYIEEEDVMRRKSGLLLQHNPVHKKVPVLLHNGRAIAESMVILEYIDEVWDQGPPILPQDPYERAMARFWVKFIDDDKCIGAMWKACWSKGEEREKWKEEAAEALKILESEIKGKKYFGGDKIGVVDHAAISIAYWLPVSCEFVGFELMTNHKYPNLCRWASDYTSEAIVKENLPDREGFIAILNKIQSKTHEYV